MIYLSITTFPDRINYFKTFYDNVIKFGADIKIILNVYDTSLRGKKLVVPEDFNNLNNLIIKFWDKDYGPILKFISVFDKRINDNDIFIYCDDDIKYTKTWFNQLIKSIKNNSESISVVSLNSGLNIFYRLRYLKYNMTNNFLRGYGGVGFYKKTIKKLDKDEIIQLLMMFNDYKLYLSDDLVISYFINKYKIICKKVDLDINKYITQFKNSNYKSSISNGANDTLESNKKRYYNLCQKYKFLGNYFGDNFSTPFYKAEFYKIKKLIELNNHFAFLRFNDGELRTIRDRSFKASNNEWIMDDNDTEFVNQLSQSLLYYQKNYIKGIPCLCCEEKDKFREYLVNDLNIKIDETFTFANVFNNSNYSYFKSDILPLLNNYKIILVANKDANINNLPFNITKWFKIQKNAHREYKKISDQILDYIKTNKISNHLFLFCAGALSNVLIYTLFTKHPNNTYLDLGSILDPLFGFKSSRNYNKLLGWKQLATCRLHYNENKHYIDCYSQNKSNFFRLILKLVNLFFNLYDYICKFLRNSLLYIKWILNDYKGYIL